VLTIVGGEDLWGHFAGVEGEGLLVVEAEDVFVLKEDGDEDLDEVHFADRAQGASSFEEAKAGDGAVGVLGEAFAEGLSVFGEGAGEAELPSGDGSLGDVAPSAKAILAPVQDMLACITNQPA